jgi:hypothetical protein
LANAIAGKLVLPQHDVLGFYVAVNDSRDVRRFESHRYLNAHTQCFVQLHWTTPQTVAQRFALDEFSGDVVGVSGFADLVNGEDVRMIERQDRARFLFEAA